MSRVVRRFSILTLSSLLAMFTFAHTQDGLKMTDQHEAASATSVRSTPVAQQTQSLSKKGVASAKYIWADLPRLTKLGATWSYGWSPWVPASQPGLDVVPMVWGAADVNNSVLSWLTKSRKAGHARALLGFNEPDHVQQANMTPDRAAALWPKLESTGLRLGSPAPADVSDGWLDRFMTLAAKHHLRVDFIALHFYPDYSNPASIALMARAIDRVWAKYRRPVWVTEIGALDIRSWGERMQFAPSVAGATKFIRLATQALQINPHVERYAWFTDRFKTKPASQTSSLYDSSGRLTAAGRELIRSP